MHASTKMCAIAAAIAATAPNAVADEVAKYACQIVGQPGPPELVGDRDGHSISIASSACRVEGGPLDGGLLTAQSIWEWDKTTGTLVSGSGVVRKVGATAVYQYTEGKLTITVADGKVTGFTGAGKGRWPVAGGGAASLAGKSFSWASKSTGAGVFETVLTAD
jgi:hypothetical protein